jgi:pimeloyl-ACP methyl ester carboxylesterase
VGLPGTGLSKKGLDSDHSLTRFATDIEAIIDHVGARNVVLVGHSIGGMTIQSLVRDRPDFVKRTVAGIILLNTTYTNPIRTTFAAGFFKGGPLDHS